MAQFCENCLLRGETNGELVNLYKVTTAQSQTTEGDWVEVLPFPIGIMIDAGHNISEPFQLPDDDLEPFERIERRLATCDNQDLSELGSIQRKLRERHCPALGELAIKQRVLKRAVKRHAKAQLL
jgi:hypothetical protein